MFYLRAGAVFVVGESVNDKRRARGAVRFVDHLLKRGGIFALSAENGAENIFVRHINRLRAENNAPHAGGVGVASRFLHLKRDKPRERPELAALFGVNNRLFVLQL